MNKEKNRKIISDLNDEGIKDKDNNKEKVSRLEDVYNINISKEEVNIKRNIAECDENDRSIKILYIR